MNKHYPFPKIRQFHQVVRDLKLRAQYVGKDENGDAVYDGTKELPVIEFIGYPKLHGTNAAIVFNRDGSYYCQSRENIITPEEDNAGFARWVAETGHKLYDDLKECFEIGGWDQAIVYGEWCGGSIQKGVAINQLPKMFVIFGLRAIDVSSVIAWGAPTYVIKNISVEGVRHISDCGAKYEIQVDLNRPELALEQLNAWVEEVDAECPFGKYLGVSGHGEGIVFRPSNEYSFDTAFKVKGESHSKSKIKKLPTVDVEKLNNIHEAVEKYCHEDRLEQAYAAIVLKEEDKVMQKVPDFMRWILNDIMTEEGDALEASNITQKEMGQGISRKAPAWFKKKISSFE